MRALLYPRLHPELIHQPTIAPRDRTRLTRLMALRILSLTTILLILVIDLSSAELFRSDSKELKNPTMDIVVTETKRSPRTSVVKIQIKTIGSSVGSSFFLLCSIRNLAQQRGQYRYITKVEEQPSRDHMLIGFLRTATESPGQLDTRLAGQQVLDLQQFSPICDKMR